MEENRDHLDLGKIPKVSRLLESQGSSQVESILFSAQVTKINRRGKSQVRVLMITSVNIFNLKDSGYKVKRKINRSQLAGITYSTQSEEFILHMNGEYDYHYLSRRRQEIVRVLTEKASPGNPVLLWEKFDRSLVRWVTQKQDLKRNIVKRPADSEAINHPFRGPSRSHSYAEDLSINDFEKCQSLSKPGASGVYLVRQVSSGRQFVMKQTRMDLMREPMTDPERVLLESLRSPFLVQVHYIFEAQPADTAIIMDYIHGCSLRDYLNQSRRLTEPQALFLSCEVILGLSQLHNVSLAYCRLRPTNIVLDQNGHAKLWDFSSVRDTRNARNINADEVVPQYTPPESLQQEPWTLSSDWWTFGVLLYEMLLGITPFFSTSTQLMLTNIKQGQVPFGGGIQISEVAKDLIRKLLTKGPNGRLGSQGVHEVQSHPFFASVNWLKMQALQEMPPIQPPIVEVADADSIQRNFFRRMTTTL